MDIGGDGGILSFLLILAPIVSLLRTASPPTCTHEENIKIVPFENKHNFFLKGKNKKPKPIFVIANRKKEEGLCPTVGTNLVQE